MIKYLLYSLLIHSILFFIIYFSFLKKDEKEVKNDQEILINIQSLVGNGIPPINENLNKLNKINNIQPQKNEEPKIKTPAKNKKNDSELKKEKIVKEKIVKEKIVEKKIEQPLEKVSKNENEKNLKNIKEPKKIIPPLQKKQNIEKAEESVSNNKIPDEKSKKDEDKNSDEFFKVMNLKAFKDINEEQQGSSLSARETINIQSQLKMCYKRAIEESGFDSKAKIIIKIQISREGYIENDLDEIIDIEKYNNPQFKDYKIIIDNIRRALDLCSPLRNLPIEKYDSWKEIILQFDIKNNSK